MFSLAALTRETTVLIPVASFLVEGIGRRRFLLIPPEILVASILGVASLWLGARLWNVDRTWALIVLFDLVVLIAVDRAVLFSTLNVPRVVPWVIPLAVIVLSRDQQAESADKSHARLQSADKSHARLQSADEDSFDGERHTMVEGLVDRTALRHL
ncbi:MAG: hypothetical protein ACI9C1_003626 [Candidatus Aldehydirespiratoraceae bacterium]